MEEIAELCRNLARMGIKPSLLLAGDKLMLELYMLQKHDINRSSWINELVIDEYKLEIIKVDKEICCVVYGKENC